MNDTQLLVSEAEAESGPKAPGGAGGTSGAVDPAGDPVVPRGPCDGGNTNQSFPGSPRVLFFVHSDSQFYQSLFNSVTKSLHP